MSDQLSSGVAVVSGCRGTIGGAICRVLAGKGYEVVGLDLVRPDIDSVAPMYKHCDTSRRGDVANVIAEIERELGDIVALVNAAGVLSRGSALTLSDEEFDRVIAANVKGTLVPCQVVGSLMAQRGVGSIVNIGSVVGKNGGNARPWLDRREVDNAANVAYGVSKSAVHTLTFFLAKELAASGVRVNGVAPGPIATSMTATLPQGLRDLIPLGRMGAGAEVAEVAEFLISDRSAFISGEIIDINGAIFCD